MNIKTLKKIQKHYGYSYGYICNVYYSSKLIIPKQELIDLFESYKKLSNYISKEKHLIFYLSALKNKCFSLEKKILKIFLNYKNSIPP